MCQPAVSLKRQSNLPLYSLSTVLCGDLGIYRWKISHKAPTRVEDSRYKEDGSGDEELKALVRPRHDVSISLPEHPCRLQYRSLLSL